MCTEKNDRRMPSANSFELRLMKHQMEYCKRFDMRAHVINLTAFSLHVIIIFFSNAGMSGNNPQKIYFFLNLQQQLAV